MFDERVHQDHVDHVLERLVPDVNQRKKLLSDVGGTAADRLAVLDMLEPLEAGLRKRLVQAWSVGNARAAFPYTVPHLTDWSRAKVLVQLRGAKQRPLDPDEVRDALAGQRSMHRLVSVENTGGLIMTQVRKYSLRKRRFNGMDYYDPVSREVDIELVHIDGTDRWSAVARAEKAESMPAMRHLMSLITGQALTQDQVREGSLVLPVTFSQAHARAAAKRCKWKYTRLRGVDGTGTFDDMELGVADTSDDDEREIPDNHPLVVGSLNSHKDHVDYRVKFEHTDDFVETAVIRCQLKDPLHPSVTFRTWTSRPAMHYVLREVLRDTAWNGRGVGDRRG